jgi:multiple antibiotic resistance protein
MLNQAGGQNQSDRLLGLLLPVLCAPVMHNLTNAFLVVYAALLPIVNPIGSAPMFLSLTRHYAAEARHVAAWRVARNGFLLLVGSLFVGSHILEFFGITLPVVRVAGGLVVSAMGWQLLNKGDDIEQRKGMGGGADAAVSRDAFYPLTMPLTVGPGSITVAITLGSKRPAALSDLADLLLLGGAAVAGIVAIAATIFVCYRFAENLERLLGEAGTNVFVRLSAFILLCIGIEILWSGCSALVGAAPP